MVTTLGSAFAATPATVPAGRFRSLGVSDAEMVVEPPPLPSLFRSAAQKPRAPPIPPATRAATATAATRPLPRPLPLFPPGDSEPGGTGAPQTGPWPLPLPIPPDA